MGSWGYGVLDNDGAHDFLSVLATKAGAEFDDEGDGRGSIFHYSFNKAKIERSMKKLEAAVNKQPADFRDVARIVLAELVMKARAKMTGKFRRAVLASVERVRERVPEEGWKSPSARTSALTRFQKKVAAY